MNEIILWAIVAIALAFIAPPIGAIFVGISLLIKLITEIREKK